MGLINARSLCSFQGQLAISVLPFSLTKVLRKRNRIQAKAGGGLLLD